MITPDITDKDPDAAPGENLTDEYADIGTPPGDEAKVPYVATAFVRGGGRSGGGFAWFCCRDGGRDRILQLANLREMEPGSVKDTFAVLHFSGMDVVLEGTGMRQVAHRIFLGRCSLVYEIHPGQPLFKKDGPVIRSIRFLVPPGKDEQDSENARGRGGKPI